MDEPSNQDKPESEAHDSEQSVELEALKKEALELLVPMVDEIKDAPERRFEILMTAARSSGDGALLKKALQTAQQIEDTNEKAGAVLDVLNEINYHLKV